MIETGPYGANSWPTSRGDGSCGGSWTRSRTRPRSCRSRVPGWSREAGSGGPRSTPPRPGRAAAWLGPRGGRPGGWRRAARAPTHPGRGGPGPSGSTRVRVDPAAEGELATYVHEEERRDQPDQPRVAADDAQTLWGGLGGGGAVRWGRPGPTKREGD